MKESIKKKLTHDLVLLEEYINKFTRKFDLTTVIGTDFSYFPQFDLVSVSLVVSDRASSNFLSFVNKNFPDIHADIFLWSLLHEIGHAETWDVFDDDEACLFKELKDNIVESNMSNDDKDNNYFAIEDELTATTWAANYMRTHQEEVKLFWDKICPMIQSIYKKYDIN